MQSGRSIYRQILATAALPAAGLSVVLLTILLVFCLNLPSPTASIVVSTAAGLAAVVLGVYLAWREIVARRQLAEAVEDSQRKQNDALALVAHQLRNPLSAIINAVDVLNLLGGTDEASEEIQQIIHRQVALLRRLVDELLDCTRVGRGKLELHRVRLDLAELLRRTVAESRDTLDAGTVSIDLELPDEPVWVLGDAARLSQVAGHLIDNAVKFSPRNCRVWVTLRPTDGNRPRATILVIDHGIGMDARTLQSAFEPFVQGSPTDARDRRGLGLGLTVARAIVELHGGQITAQSEGPGQGTTISFSLPIEAPVPQEAEACTPATHSGRCRVVIIDDRRDAAYTLRRILELSGHEVHVASDGPQGIDLALAVRPDLVLCDIGLEGEMSGYDVAQALRRAPETAGVHLVAVTGYGQEEVRDRAVQAGFDRHLVKPASIAVLNQIIAELPCSTDNHKQAVGNG